MKTPQLRLTIIILVSILFIGILSFIFIASFQEYDVNAKYDQVKVLSIYNMNGKVVETFECCYYDKYMNQFNLYDSNSELVAYFELPEYCMLKITTRKKGIKND